MGRGGAGWLLGRGGAGWLLGPGSGLEPRRARWGFGPRRRWRARQRAGSRAGRPRRPPRLGRSPLSPPPRRPPARLPAAALARGGGTGLRVPRAQRLDGAAQHHDLRRLRGAGGATRGGGSVVREGGAGRAALGAPPWEGRVQEGSRWRGAWAGCTRLTAASFAGGLPRGRPVVHESRTSNLAPLNPEPQIPSPKPQTSNLQPPEPQTLNPGP